MAQDSDMVKSRRINRRKYLGLLGATGAGINAMGTVSADQGETTKQSSNDHDSLDSIVGAHYTTWLHPNERYVMRNWTKECAQTPTWDVGWNYDVANEGVINQHVEWATQYGVNTFFGSWAGPESYTDKTIRNFLDTTEPGQTNLAVLYESSTRLRFPGGIAHIDSDFNQEALRDTFRYMEENFFNRSNYLHIDGKPVVFMYLAWRFTTSEGTPEALERAMRGAIREGLQDYDDVYLIGHSMTLDTRLKTEEEAMQENIAPFDAITWYNGYAPALIRKAEGTEGVSFVDLLIDLYERWADAAERQDTAFMPEVLPGYNDTKIVHAPRPYNKRRPILERDPERFDELCRRADKLRNGDVDGVFITSWNEWFEGTHIEPSIEDGDTFLDIVRHRLTDKPPRGSPK